MRQPPEQIILSKAQNSPYFLSHIVSRLRFIILSIFTIDKMKFACKGFRLLLHV